MECLLGKWLRHRGAALVKGLTKGKRRAPKLFRPRRVRPCLEVLEDILAPAVFTVTSLTDDGTGAAGTLSAAINGANANPNSTIDFNLPGGAPQTIDVTGTLPAITAPTFIDGFSQGGDNPGVFVGLDGGRTKGNGGTTGPGLTVNSGGVTIAGLAIYGFNGDGVQLNNGLDSPGNMLVADFIGTDVTGTTQGVGNAGNGVLIAGAYNTISGLDSGLPNIISGNGANGIDIQGATAVDNVVETTSIGLDATGKTPLANAANGVYLEQGATGNTIGPKPGSGATGNEISGNGQSGVYLSNANGNWVYDNDIGAGIDGLTQVANGKNGVSLLNGSSGNTIGNSVCSAPGNVISGNTGQGVYLSGPSVTGNLIEGDYIGVGEDGKTKVANTANGVYLDAGSGNGNTVGGQAWDQNNVISGNGGAGVYLTSIGNKNLIAYNMIGTDYTGLVAVPNSGDGIDVYGNNNTIGALTTPAQGPVNLVSGNSGNGIVINNGSCNLVNGNWIGTDFSGLKALGNQKAGIYISGSAATKNTIGAVQPVGQNPSPANIISGNGQPKTVVGYGIWISSGSTGTAIEGDFIGVGADGTTPLGNVESGIRLGSNVSKTVIGGAQAGASNTISANGSDPMNDAYGVEIDSSASNNTIQGNNIGTSWQGTQGAQWQNKTSWRLDDGAGDQWSGNKTQPN